MSLLLKRDHYALIDHSEFINKIYNNVSDGTNINSYELTRNLFSIIIEVNRKRTHDYDKLQVETLNVKQMYERFLTDLPTELRSSILSKYSLLAPSGVRDMSKKLFESTIFDHSGINGGNNLDMPLKCEVKGEYFLVPGKSRFFCGCVKDQCKKLEGAKFDILVADPPWWNKYIRRLKSANNKLSYSMMYNEDIAAIPVKDLLAPNCLIAVWCTNAPSNIDAVKNLIFPRWGVTYVTTWYWLKVTVDLQPLCPFGSGFKKQPYERLMIGTVGDVKVPETQLVVSVPSALHSHKPPLLELLSPYVKAEDPQTLELFARYLLPNTTSIGYEPLKWQHLSLFNSVLLDNLK